MLRLDRGIHFRIPPNGWVFFLMRTNPAHSEEGKPPDLLNYGSVCK